MNLSLSRFFIYILVMFRKVLSIASLVIISGCGTVPPNCIKLVKDVMKDSFMSSGDNPYFLQKVFILQFTPDRSKCTIPGQRFWTKYQIQINPSGVIQSIVEGESCYLYTDGEYYLKSFDPIISDDLSYLNRLDVIETYNKFHLQSKTSDAIVCKINGTLSTGDEDNIVIRKTRWNWAIEPLTQAKVEFSGWIQ
jgi:hypothetical protein